VNSELPGPSALAGASQYVRPEDVAEAILCGSDVDTFVEAIRAFPEAGYTQVALVQIGGDQQAPFIEWANRDLLPALRST
jgi:hypothetical protein